MVLKYRYIGLPLINRNGLCKFLKKCSIYEVTRDYSLILLLNYSNFVRKLLILTFQTNFKTCLYNITKNEKWHIFV